MRRIATFILLALAVMALAAGMWTLDATAAAPSKKGVAGPGSSTLTEAPAIWDALVGPDGNAHTWRPSYLYAGDSRFVATTNSIGSAKKFIGMGYTGPFIVGNEPDNCYQDGKTPKQAAEDYGKVVEYIQAALPGADIYVLGLYQANVSWLRSYQREYLLHWGHFPTHSYHVHCYTWRGSDSESLAPLLSQLDAWIAVAGTPVMITEFGNLGRTDTAAMLEMAAHFEAHPKVKAYFYFYAGHPQEPWWDATSLVAWDANGWHLTELGEVYAELGQYVEAPIVERVKRRLRDVIGWPPGIGVGR